MMQQGKHSLGPLFMEWSVARPKTMLILLLCHPQVRPLCSNTPAYPLYGLVAPDRLCRSHHQEGADHYDNSKPIVHAVGRGHFFLACHPTTEARPDPGCGYP